MEEGATNGGASPAAPTWGNCPAKRCLDILGSGLLLLLSAPAWPLVALLIKLGSPGPVLLRQVRAGRLEKPFRLLKFRSMREEMERAANGRSLNGGRVGWPEGSPQGARRASTRKQRSALRTTAFGRILRRTSLDELPQLINVFCGHMSLIGPRPLVFADLENPHDIAPSERQVHPEAVLRWRQARCLVRPGMTGLWQVRGRSSLPLEGLLRYDAEYVQRSSPGFDLAVLLRTVPAVLRGIGAL